MDDSDLIDGQVERLAGTRGFLEGPVWVTEHQMLLFTDIPADRILRWRGDDGVGDWLVGSHFAIGLARDRSGRIIVCEHTTRALTAYEVDAAGSAGEREVLAAGVGTRVLNSTNDVAVASDGTILFTDPPFGVRIEDGQLHGYEQAMELPYCGVFRVGPDAASPEPLLTSVYRPNGLCLSPDERRLYVSDSSERHHTVYACEIGPGWALSEPEVFAVMPEGVPDGMRPDALGRIWVAGGDGVYVYTPDGALAGHVAVPEMVTNLAFGGADGRDVFITATTSLYRCRSRVPGAGYGPGAAAA